MLIDRNKEPQGGYRFRDAQIGKLISGLSFRKTVESIIALRKANPRFNLSTDWNTVAKELDDRTCFQLKNDPRYCTADIPPAPPPSFPQGLASPQPPVQGPSGNVAGASKFAKNTAVGIGLFMEWFGDGMPVETALAEKRANICLTCPKNVRGNLLQRFTQSAAQEIMGIFSVLNDLDLHTSREDELGTCDVCDCALKAKVFCPRDIILNHTSAEVMAGFPDFCWIKNEK